MNSSIKLYLAISIAGMTQLSAQQFQFRFNHLTVDDGLSQTTPNCIIQDSYGFMWFGTQDGLNRFDGYNFKIFNHESGNINSLSNNYIWTIYEDEDGIFWIGYFGGGLTRLDPATESYTHFKNNSDNPNSISSNDVFGIAEHPAGTLWLRTGMGINKFDKKTKRFTRFLNSSDDSTANLNSYIGALAVQPTGFVWAGIDSSLVRLNTITNEIEYFLSYPEKDDLKFGTINNIKYNNGNLFICCSTGLIKIDLNSNRSSKIPVPIIIGEKRISFNHILIDDNNYWIGTNYGLFLYDIANKTFKHFKHDANNPNSLLHNNIVSLYKSNEGIIWIGTYNGINKIDQLNENFSLVQFNHYKKNTLSHSSVGPILEDKNGIVWFGTPNGLNAYNRFTNENIIFKSIPGNASSLSSNYILSLYEDKKGNIWVGTRDAGINKFEYDEPSKIKNISFERINLPDKSLRIQSIMEDNFGTLWIGTAGKGLAAYNKKTGRIKFYPSVIDGKGPSHPFIYCMYEDSKGNFWFGTPTGGLNLFDRKSEKFLYIKNKDDNLNSLSNNIVLSIFEDSKNKLWIGTSEGLNRLDTPLKTNLFNILQDSTLSLSFTRFGRKHGLPNDVIYGILEDDSGFLWISTNKGLIKFNPDTGIPVKIFDSKDGLQNNEFNQNSYFKNGSGLMYFGGIGGFNYFHPDSISQNEYVPPIHFTSFHLFNEPVKLKNQVNDKSFYLDRSIYLLDEIELSHNQNVITFEFAALNFILPNKNQYSYMLEGFDNNWNTVGNKRTVTYTNLDAGNYTLRVRGSNNDGIWNETGAAIKLIIAPPPWLSWYAYLIYLGVISSIIFLFINFRIKGAKKEIETHVKIEKAKLEEREEVRKQSSADFHDEAGNKLTKISLFTELAKSESENNPSLREYLAKIEENTKEISSGMRDFIWVLDPSKESMYDTISRLKDFGNSMFDYTDIRFAVKGLNEEMRKIILPMEYRRAIMLIFKEAMNNCLKYSSAKTIVMEVSANKRINLRIKDDGKGFNLEEKYDGYGLNNMRERANKINCEIKIISKLNEGTSITVIGNIPQMSD